jgi:protein-S-isoprenylcysteine O-methyltransferase Ste14
MKYFAILLCLTTWMGNFFIYSQLSQKLHENPKGGVHYPLSWPTRMYKHLKKPLYFAVLLHIFLQAFVANEFSYSVLRLTVGGIIAVGGLVLLRTALVTLGNNFSPCYDGVLPTHRVIAGPYKYLRHPIYAANIFQFIAALILVPGPIIYVAFLLLIWMYFYAIRDENRSLDSNFPSSK